MSADWSHMERWQDIPGYEDLYQVSTEGRVKGQYGRCLKQYKHPAGYNDVDLYGHDKAKKKKKVHRLVLEAFVGPCPEGMECRHLDGDSRNNRLENLQWGTRAENMADMVRHGTRLKHERHPGAKLTAEQVRAIRAASGPQGAIGARYGVTQSMVSYIQRGASWAGV